MSSIDNPFAVTNPHLIPTSPIEEHFQRNRAEFQDTIANPEAAEGIRAANQRPKGWYSTDADYRPTVFPQVNTDEDGTRTGVPGPRNMGVVLARVTQRVKGEVYTSVIRVEISPDARAKREYVNGSFSGFHPTKHDSAHRMYAEAQGMYKAIHGQNATSITALIDFLADTGFKANCMVRDDGSLLPYQLAPLGGYRG